MRAKYILFFLLMLVTGLSANQPQWAFNSSSDGWNCPFFVEKYFHHSELQTQWAFELMGQYPLRNDEQILDFGCGDGKLTALFSRFLTTGKIVGVDLSEEMVHFAHIKFPPYAYPNLQFLHTQSIDFADWNPEQTYDKIITFCTLHLVKNPETVLKNLRSYLKPNGQLLAVLPAEGNPELFAAASKLFKEMGRDAPWVNPTVGPTLRSLDGCRTLLTQARFTVDHLKKIDIDVPFVTKQELLNWLIGTTGPNWHISPEQCPEFFTRVIEEMMALDPNMVDAEGRIHFKMSRIQFVAH